MKKTTAKKLLDSILLCLFFAELGGMFLPHPVHEVLGCLFIALIVLHNIKNHYFYTHFLAGTYSPLRPRTCPDGIFQPCGQYEFPVRCRCCIRGRHYEG